jgi:hypothetical protein
VLAYKVLMDGRSGFTGWRWPLPDADSPGEWVLASEGPLELCINGVHACSVAQLPQWLGDQIWRIELGGDVVDAGPALVASRGRLLGPLAAWDRTARGAFSLACARRATRFAERVAAGGEVLELIHELAAAGDAGEVGYWAAVLAGEAVSGRRQGADYDAEFVRERATQADWLGSELGLTA